MRAFLRFFDAAFGRYAATSALATATDFALAYCLHVLEASAALATFVGCVAGGRKTPGQLRNRTTTVPIRILTPMRTRLIMPVSPATEASEK